MGKIGKHTGRRGTDASVIGICTALRRANKTLRRLNWKP